MAREAHGLGRPGADPSGALYGRARGGALQSCHTCVLPTPARCGQDEEGGTDRLYAKAADHSECDAETSDPMARRTGSVCLTGKTDRMSLRLTTWDENIVALMSVAWQDGRRGGLGSRS